MLKIGMLGPDYLRKRNGDIFQQQQIKAITVYNEQQLSHIDGLLITGWNTSGYIRPLQRLLPSIQQQLPQLSVFGIAAGAVSLGRNGPLSAMDCDITMHSARQLTTASLEMPGYLQNRFTACFLPQIQFKNLAPNLGILCQDQKNNPIVVRQGNYLACSYVAELTPQPYIYNYWLDMVAALKNSRKN